MSITLLKYILTAAVRDKFVLSIGLLFLIGGCLSLFLGSAAVNERDQFSLVFAASGLRFLGVAGLSLFVVSFLRRSFESRDIEYLLSRPVGRKAFVVSYAVAFSFLALLIGVLQGVSLFILSGFSVHTGLVLWSVSLVAENIIMANASLFFAMALGSSVSAMLSVLGFYVLSRVMGQVLGIIDSGVVTGWTQALEGVMQGISALMPRLDLLGQGEWLVYGVSEISAGTIVLQGLIYTVVFVAATCVDLSRRQF